MSSEPSFTAALEGLRHAAESGRLAHAYLIVGSPRGEAMALTEALLRGLFCVGPQKPCGQCAECRRVERHLHPDVVWLEPESKSRRIQIDAPGDHAMGVRDLTRFMALAPMVGPWKVGVLVHADRLTSQAANACLKLLEEPPPYSLLLLLTDVPQAILPTLLSRCQKITLSGADADQPAWRPDVLEMLRAGPPKGPLAVLAQAARLENLLAGLEKELAQRELERAKEWEASTGAEADRQVLEARVRARRLQERSAMLQLMLHWYRDVLLLSCGAGEDQLLVRGEAEAQRRQAAGLTPADALKLVHAVEEVHRRLEANLGEESAVTAAFLDRAGAPRRR